MKTISAADMRAIDRRAIDEFNIPGDLLMERAGQGVAEIALDVLHARMAHSILLIAGCGNNGGDVFAAATFLAEANVEVTVWIYGSKRQIKGDAEYHLKKMIRRGIHPTEIQRIEDCALERRPAVIVDGLLGTGSSGAPRGVMSDLVEWINRAAQHSFVIAIDLPTGVDADTGTAAGSAVFADLTATICLPKTGLICPQALPYVGNVEVVPIGIPFSLRQAAAGCPAAELIDRTDLHIPARNNESYKGHYGHVLLVGGSVGYTGAIAMAARAALRAGAGLVSILTPAEVYPIVAQAAGPEVMVHPQLKPSIIPDSLLLGQAIDERFDAIVLGPGMGRGDATRSLVQTLLRELTIPLILDADALCVDPTELRESNGPVLITPHPGEFKRLFGSHPTDRWAQARAASDQIGNTLILKGAGTVVAHPGRKLGINMSGNPGMATAGAGDVLAGILGALLGRGMAPFEAACASVHLHGVAGDIAAGDCTQESLIATDLIRALPDAFRLLNG